MSEPTQPTRAELETERAKLQRRLSILSEMEQEGDSDAAALAAGIRQQLADIEVQLTAIHSQPPPSKTAVTFDQHGQDVEQQLNVGGSMVIAQEGARVYIGVEQPVEMPSVERESALGRYLQHIISRNRYLQLQGIRSGGRVVNIELDQIYITLRATRQRVPQAESAWLEEEATLAPGEACRLREGPDPATEAVTVSVNEALLEHSRLAVLGDPGSGKTTLLRYLVLLYARDLAEDSRLVQEKLGLAESGWLPILLLPLRQIGAFLKTHHPTDDGIEGHARLLEFLRQSLAGERIKLPADFFDPWLNEGRAVVLLDGLDEVADADLRRRVSRLVESFTVAYPDCRYVVASRIVGYTGPARLGEGYTTTTVRDFMMTDVERFLTNWHRLVAVGQMGPGASAEAYAAEQTRQLRHAIAANERIRELAINPLMLTVIAMVHRDRVKLPDRRAELYAEAVDVLLGKWDEARGVAEVPILPGQVFDTGDRRLILQNLALYMHEQNLKEIAASELRTWLNRAFAHILNNERDIEPAVNRFLRMVEERTGLLMARGEGVYTFNHLTFQEYLVALAVVGRDDYVDYTLAHAPDPWWREVVLLEAGYLSTQSTGRTTRLIQAIAHLEKGPEPYHNLILAAECLRDVGGQRVQGNLAGEVQQQLRRELETRPGLLSRWFSKLGANDWAGRRTAAAQALTRIGGETYWTQPYGEPAWVEIPAGEFLMGTDRQELEKAGLKWQKWMEDETPQHKLYLAAFCISRALVTNAQYRIFVEAGGYQQANYWPEAIGVGYWREGQVKRRFRKERKVVEEWAAAPVDYGSPFNLANHPVVGINWYEAMSYAHWLTEQLRQAGALGLDKIVTLPSETQWEKAARGTDGRIYSWGSEWSETKCNTKELGLDGTTPVGIFPNGASPYGCLDMAGNVWEWTRSLWGPWKDNKAILEFGYPYNPTDGRENLAADDNYLRVLRGGAWYNNQSAARCAYRNGYFPDLGYYSIGFRVVVSPVSPTSAL